jgi:hypothetical protein
MDGRVKPGHDVRVWYDPGSAQQRCALQRARETGANLSTVDCA